MEGAEALLEAVIDTAVEEDLSAVLALQKLAFLDAARQCGDFSIPPLRQTFDELVEESRSSCVLVARIRGTIIGTVRSRRDGETCFVMRLAVHPDHRRRGIGRRLLRELERRAIESGANRFELFTGESNRGNIALYEGMGYRIYRTERPASGPALVYMEKSVGRN